MKILLTNDDGISSPNIKLLAKRLSENGHHVFVFAPHTQKSACSQSLTVHQAFGYTETKDYFGAECAVAVEGTPSDCIKIAVHIFEIVPDLVVSGPNEGSNLGTDILYSGTVAGAMQGLICGFPSLALSQCGRNVDPEYCVEFFCRNIEKIFSLSVKESMLNINIPHCDPKEIKGVRFTKMGISEYNDAYMEIEENGRKIYRLTGELLRHEDDAEECDVKLSQRGYITITPLMLDRTDYHKLDELNKTEW